MKTSFEIIAVAAAVAAVSVSCSKNELEVENIQNTPKVTIKVNAVQSDLTRTAVDATNAVSWSAGDAIGIFQSVDGVKGTAKVSSTGLAAAAEKASFSATFDAADGTEFKYVAAYPASAIEWSTDTTFVAFGQEYPYAANTRVNDSTLMKSKLTELYHERFRVKIPRDQKPTETSWDPAADVLVSKVVTSETQPGELNMEFHRLGTAVKMTLLGLEAGEVIKYVDFSTTEAKICGRTHINPLTGALYDKGYSCGGNVIHIVPAAERTTTGSDVFWFRTLAGTLTDNFSVAVVTDKAYYVKTADLKTAGSLEFAEEGLTTFSVSGLVRHDSPTDLVRTGWIVTTSHPVFQEKTANEGIEFTQALCDGNDNTRFCQIRPGKGPVRTVEGTQLQVSKTDTTWFQLDLGEQQAVSCLRARNRPKAAGLQLRLAGFDEIRGSNDGINWKTITRDIKLYNTQNVEETANIPIPASSYRYYKFVMLDQKCFYQGYYLSNGNTWQMREFYLAD